METQHWINPLCYNMIAKTLARKEETSTTDHGSHEILSRFPTTTA